MTAPPVSFVMLSYRQEGLVREAVRAALAQDYPNLEIIISDDCSPDGTLAAIKEEVAGYSGPHRVVVRQPETNLGLLPHLYDAVGAATGELLVLAAGDDVSFPHRVSRLAAEWQRTGADALCSGWTLIDEDGTTLGTFHGGRSDLRFRRYFFGRPFTQIIGATAAYTAAVFRHVPKPSAKVFAEDLYLSLLLHWRGRRVVEIEEPLIAYRQHAQAMTNAGRDQGSVLEHERSVAREAARVADLLEEVAGVTATVPEDEWGKPGDIDRAALEEDAAFNRFRATWMVSDLLARTRAFLRFGDPAHRRWLLPRLPGFRLLEKVKLILR